MNRSQRVLVLVTLTVSALVLHLWNLEWQRREDSPDWYERTKHGFATVSWTRPYEPSESIVKWGPESESEGFYDFSGWRDPELEYAHKWVGKQWRLYKLLGTGTWVDFLRQHNHTTVYFGLWSKGSDGDSWIWGIFAPSGMLVCAAYLLLGRKPQLTP